MGNKNKTVILLFGLQGSGKSTIANELVKILKGEVLTTEVVRADLFEIPPSKKDVDFSDLELRLTYKVIEMLLSRLSNYCELLIVEGVYRSQSQRDKIIDFCLGNEIRVFPFYITCSENEAKLRLNNRKTRKVIQPGGYETYLKVKKIFDYPINGEEIIDTTHISFDANIEKILNAIK